MGDLEIVVKVVSIDGQSSIGKAIMRDLGMVKGRERCELSADNSKKKTLSLPQDYAPLKQLNRSADLNCQLTILTDCEGH